MPESVSLNPINQSLLATTRSDRFSLSAGACPDGNIQVPTVEECKKAASFLRIPLLGTGSGSNAQSPFGCIWRVDNDIYFNAAEDGSNHKLSNGERKLVCTAQLFSLSAGPCPDGNIQVPTVEKCKKAASFLRIPLLGTGSGSTPNSPSGCIWRIDNDIYFNAAEDGSNHKLSDGDRQLVCMTVDPFEEEEEEEVEPVYTLGNPGLTSELSDDICPSGFARLLDYEECGDLHAIVKLPDGTDKRLDRTKGNFRESCESHFTRNAGCFANNAGAVYFTSDDCSARPDGRSGHYPVCKAI